MPRRRSRVQVPFPAPRRWTEHIKIIKFRKVQNDGTKQLSYSDQSDQMKRLHPNAVKVFRLKIFLGLTLVGGLLLNFLLFGQGIFLILPMIFIFRAISRKWAQQIYENYAYELAEDRINIKCGVIWKKHVAIPYQKIQNVDIVQGPISHRYGVADLLIQTAGVSGSTMVEGRIPAIAPDEAERLKNQILEKVAGTSKEQDL